jgi:hypothetical protein
MTSIHHLPDLDFALITECVNGLEEADCMDVDDGAGPEESTRGSEYGGPDEPDEQGGPDEQDGPGVPDEQDDEQDEQDGPGVPDVPEPGEPEGAAPAVVWGRIQNKSPLSFCDVKSILKLSPSMVSYCSMSKTSPYEGDTRTRVEMEQVLAMPGVEGALRISRKLKGEHAFWIVFGKGSACRAIRCSTAAAILKTEGVFDAKARGKKHEDGAFGDHCFLSADVGGKRFNFVDMVEKLL